MRGESTSQVKNAIDAAMEGRPKEERAVWHICLDEPRATFYVGHGEEGGHEDVALGAVLWGMHVPFRYRKTERTDVSRIDSEWELERISLFEDRMRSIMHVMRANGYHGSYHKDGSEEEYRF